MCRTIIFRLWRRNHFLCTSLIFLGWAPKAGAVGTLTATTTSQSFIVEGSEYLKDDDTWIMGNGPALKLNFPLLKVIVSPLQTDVPSLCPAAMSSIKAQRLTATEAH